MVLRCMTKGCRTRCISANTARGLVKYWTLSALVTKSKLPPMQTAALKKCLIHKQDHEDVCTSWPRCGMKGCTCANLHEYLTVDHLPKGVLDYG
eukprot:3543224-Amphidinium_carterae.1